MTTTVRALRKTRQGKVVSDKGDKTIIVAVVRLIRHPLYERRYRSTKRYSCHDPENTAREGDLVEIMEIRPMSKTKRWRLVKVVTAAK